MCTSDLRFLQRHPRECLPVLYALNEYSENILPVGCGLFAKLPKKRLVFLVANSPEQYASVLSNEHVKKYFNVKIVSAEALKPALRATFWTQETGLIIFTNDQIRANYQALHAQGRDDDPLEPDRKRGWECCLASGEVLDRLTFRGVDDLERICHDEMYLRQKMQRNIYRFQYDSMYNITVILIKLLLASVRELHHQTSFNGLKVSSRGAHQASSSRPVTLRYLTAGSRGALASNLAQEYIKLLQGYLYADSFSQLNIDLPKWILYYDCPKSAWPMLHGIYNIISELQVYYSDYDLNLILTHASRMVPTVRAEQNDELERHSTFNAS